MTKAHRYTEGKSHTFYIDGKKVSERTFYTSYSRSQGQKQRRINERAGISKPVVKSVPAKPVPISVRRYKIYGTARPKSKSNARTPDLEQHTLTVDEYEGNIDEQEQLLNEKYPSWVHFDTYIEEIP